MKRKKSKATKLSTKSTRYDDDRDPSEVMQVRVPPLENSENTKLADSEKIKKEVENDSLEINSSKDVSSDKEQEPVRDNTRDKTDEDVETREITHFVELEKKDLSEVIDTSMEKGDSLQIGNNIELESANVVVENGRIVIQAENGEEEEVEDYELVEIAGKVPIEMNESGSVEDKFNPEVSIKAEPETENQSDKIALYQCTTCHKEFKSKRGYDCHMINHVGDLLPCPYCDKKYRLKTSLNNHMVTHEEEKRYKCEFCEKAYNYLGSLKDHYNTHIGEKVLKCDMCEQTFNYYTNLLRHKRRHEGVVYKCDICDKTFVEQTSIYRHRQLHIGEKNHKCDVCGKSFLRAGNMRVHRKTHEPREPRSNDYKCEHCDKSYPYKSSLRKHYKCKHAKQILQNEIPDGVEND